MINMKRLSFSSVRVKIAGKRRSETDGVSGVEHFIIVRFYCVRMPMYRFDALQGIG
jgi:hypothetical protein